VVGRDRTCAAPRFRRPLSTELRPQAKGRRRGMGEAGFEPAACAVQKTECWTSARGGLSYSPRGSCQKNPGQGLEPRSPHSECGVLPARRSRNVFCCVHDTFGQSRTMLFKPLACPSALDRGLEKSSCVLRGGDLEPGALAASEIRRQKQQLIQQRIQPARSAEGPFSLRRSLESERWFLKLGITPWLSLGSGLKTTKATRWVAFAQSWMRLAC
jgi:hypothetical protein